MPTSAREWKQANRKEVTLKSGRSATIRKLSSEFLLVLQELQEDLGKLGVTQKPGADGKPRYVLPASYMTKYVEQLVMHAVVVPTLVTAGTQAGDDEMHVVDFGEDLDELVTAIHDFNGGILEIPFRAATGSEAPAPAGEGVRGATEPAPEGAAGGPDV